MRNIVSPLDGFLSPFGTRFVGAAVVPIEGLIADWRFADGSGTTVTDETGTYDIDLTEATDAAATWETYGVNAAAIETPVITNVRTTVMLYRIPADETSAFHLSGPVATNAGIYGTSTSNLNCHIGQGYGVGSVPDRGDGEGGYWLTAGGWRLLIVEQPVATTGFQTFGSRGNSTSNRFTDFRMAWGAVYDRVLTDTDRAALYSFARSIARDRSISLDFRDLSAKADMLWLWGQSNADGRGLIADLPAPDQARTYDDVYISQDDVSISAAAQGAFDLLSLGSNHNENSSTQFGAEVPWANNREDNPTGRPLYILKNARGSTGIAPKSLSGDPVSYSTQESEVTAGFWNGLLRHYYYAISNALENNVGLDLKAFVAFQGEQDAQNTTLANVWEANFNLIVDKLELHTGLSGFPIYVTRIRDDSPPDATALAIVRAAQEDVVSTLGARASLVDVDSYDYNATDDIHLTADGIVSYGDFIWADLGL